MVTSLEVLDRFLNKSVQDLTGVGESLTRRLHNVGLNTFWDMLTFVPSHYATPAIGSESVGQEVCLSVTYKRSIGQKPWRFVCHTSEGVEISLIFFKRPAWRLAPVLHISGVLQTSRSGAYELVHPTIHQKAFKERSAYACYTIVGISSARFSRWIEEIFSNWDILWRDATATPPWLKEIRDALRHMHFPHDMPLKTLLNIKNHCLIYHEMLAHQLIYLKTKKARAWPIAAEQKDFLVAEKIFLNNAGYSLTSSQQKSWQEIRQDMHSTEPMIRLLHGEVGSGKTIIAFLAMLASANAGYRAYLMAPTETLIRQHFSDLQRLLQGLNLRAQLILGKGQRLGPQDALLILGTHALLYDLSPENCALVVIDEQQRFGVAQRLQLLPSQDNTHTHHALFLSATPIPRTLECLLRHQLSLSCLDKRHANHNIQSKIISDQRLEELEQWIARCIQNKTGVYWVCPSIEDEKTGVLARHAYWQERFPQHVGFLHGALSSDEKERVIHDFRLAKILLLISTTVIEVGIHVDHACTMILDQSPMFGLSQIHQLRGRVGRNGQEGFCFLLYSHPISPQQKRRIQFIRDCHDGFVIAEQDHQWRGCGNVFGTQQSGFTGHKFFMRYEEHPEIFQKVQDNIALIAQDELYTQFLCRYFISIGQHLMHAG